MTDADLPAPDAEAPQPADSKAPQEPAGESPFGTTRAPAPPAFNRTAAAWAAAAALVILCLLVNLASLPFLDEMIGGGTDEGSEVVIAIGVGIMAGEVAVLSMLLVWANGHFFLRFVLCWLMGLMAFCCWLVGALASIDEWDREMLPEFATIVLAALPLVSLSLQLPQWWMRIYLHWRLVLTDPGVASQSRQPLSIRDILAGTTIVALTITATRLTAGESEVNVGFWFMWAIISGILMTTGQLILMPLVVLVLRVRSILPSVVFIFVAPVAFPIVMAVIAAIDRTGGPPSEAYVLTYVASLACLATASAPLWIARMAGYRLALG